AVWAPLRSSVVAALRRMWSAEDRVAPQVWEQGVRARDAPPRTSWRPAPADATLHKLSELISPPERSNRRSIAPSCPAWIGPPDFAAVLQWPRPARRPWLL